MVMTDPIGDMLSRIRNAYAVGQKSVNIPYSQAKLRIAEILSKEKFIGEVKKIKESKNQNYLSLKLLYPGGQPAITGVERVSKPGLRIYQRTDKIPVIRRGNGFYILSTDQGLMTDKEARQKNLGGELVCKVWF